MITCKFEEGKDVALRHVVVHCLVLNGNKILLIKRAEGMIEGGKWGFPGGFMDRDETAEEACLRELKEETGYEGSVKNFFRLNSNPNRKNDAGRQNLALEYLIEIGEKTTEPDHEVTEVKWFDIDKIDLTLIAFDQDRSIEMLRKFLKGEIDKPIFE